MKAQLTGFVFAVYDDQPEWIGEHLFGNFEADAMLLEVAFRFLLPPGELNPYSFSLYLRLRRYKVEMR